MGRLCSVHPNQGDIFLLYILLANVPHFTSFQRLKMVNRTTYATFRSVCQALSLLENDQHWDALH